jgi:hypothetical protein
MELRKSRTGCAAAFTTVVLPAAAADAMALLHPHLLPSSDFLSFPRCSRASGRNASVLVGCLLDTRLGGGGGGEFFFRRRGLVPPLPPP